MFGLFKKSITPDAFGVGILEYSYQFLCSDADRSLGARFPGFDASAGWIPFLRSRGVDEEQQSLFRRLFTHCSIQAACTQFDLGLRQTITNGAISAFTGTPQGYDFAHCFTKLEGAYDGQSVFSPRVSALNSDARIAWLPAKYQTAGLDNARFLMDVFVIRHMPNSDAFFQQFGGFSSTANAGIGTVGRAVNALLKSFKL